MTMRKNITPLLTDTVKVKTQRLEHYAIFLDDTLATHWTELCIIGYNEKKPFSEKNPIEIEGIVVSNDNLGVLNSLVSLASKHIENPILERIGKDTIKWCKKYGLPFIQMGESYVRISGNGQLEQSDKPLTFAARTGYAGFPVSSFWSKLTTLYNSFLMLTSLNEDLQHQYGFNNPYTGGIPSFYHPVRTPTDEAKECIKKMEAGNAEDYWNTRLKRLINDRNFLNTGKMKVEEIENHINAFLLSHLKLETTFSIIDGQIQTVTDVGDYFALAAYQLALLTNNPKMKGVGKCPHCGVTYIVQSLKKQRCEDCYPQNRYKREKSEKQKEATNNGNEK